MNPMDNAAEDPLLERFREIRDQILEELRAGSAEARADLEGTRQRLLAELRASRAEQRRATSAHETAIADDRAVTREMLLDMREGREQLIDIRHGIQATQPADARPVADRVPLAAPDAMRRGATVPAGRPLTSLEH